MDIKAITNNSTTLTITFKYSLYIVNHISIWDLSGNLLLQHDNPKFHNNKTLQIDLPKNIRNCDVLLNIFTNKGIHTQIINLQGHAKHNLKQLAC